MVDSKNILEFLDQVADLHTEVCAAANGFAITTHLSEDIPCVELQIDDKNFKNVVKDFLGDLPIKNDDSDASFVIYKNIKWYNSDEDENIKVDNALIDSAQKLALKVKELAEKYGMTNELGLYISKQILAVSIYNLSLEEAEIVKTILEKETNTKIRAHQTTVGVPYKDKKFTLFF